MKALEAMERKGLYWYFRPGKQQTIVHCEGDEILPFTFLGNERPYQADELPGEFIGPIEYPPADASELRAIATEMRERKVNNGKHESATLVAWANRIDAILDRMGVPK